MTVAREQEIARRKADPVRALVEDILRHDGHRDTTVCLEDIFHTARAILVILDREAESNG